MSALRASYRLQLRGGVGFRELAELAPQLGRLGISHLYLSPILRARRGSTHGYDGVDPTVIDPALGGEADLEALVRRLRRLGLGILLDIVPNHLALAPGENPFVDDVLAHGPASPFAPWFDVDWGPAQPGRHAPWLLPLLERPLAEARARGELELVRRGGAFFVLCAGLPLPLDPATGAVVLERARSRLPRGRAHLDANRALRTIARALRALPARGSREARGRRERAARLEAELCERLAGSRVLRRALDAALREAGRPAALGRLLALQAWRLDDWRRARRRLNHRRFFDVDDLVALRQEDAAVFAATHRKILELVERGLVHGLRVDHVDGLCDPRSYLRRLRREVDARLPAARRSHFPVLVEKILARNEQLPRGWPVDGSTGYEFLNELEATLLEPDGVRAIEAGWMRRTGLRRSFAETARRSKRRALDELLSADLDRLAAHAAGSRGPRERAALRRALRELVVQLPVYRTYADRRGRLRAEDERLLLGALAAARRERIASSRSLRRLADRLGVGTAARRRSDPALLTRLQQLSGPAAAKGVEDTALYLHTPLLSRNEVGADPGADLDDALPAFHAACRRRNRHWPGTLLAGTTHDTKRSADVRARLDVLSEVPDLWREALGRWCRASAPLRRRGRRGFPDRGTELLLYQTLVGLWPARSGAARLPSQRALAALRSRVAGYALKAAREAKAHTSWVTPDPVFEAGLEAFVDDLLGAAGRSSGFLADLSAFVAEVARPGLWNALARSAVQLAAPGVPDLYQGEELFAFSLVDPDNRRRVDFAKRRRALLDVARRFAAPARRHGFLREVLARPEDGRAKLHLLRTGLAARRRRPELFARTDYEPLEASGPATRHVLAFARSTPGGCLVLAVPRLPRTLVGDGRRAPVGDVWGATRLALPRRLSGSSLLSVFTGERLTVPVASRPELPLARLMAHFPAALLLTRRARG